MRLRLLLRLRLGLWRRSAPGRIKAQPCFCFCSVRTGRHPLDRIAQRAHTLCRVAMPQPIKPHVMRLWLRLLSLRLRRLRLRLRLWLRLRPRLRLRLLLLRLRRRRRRLWRWRRRRQRQPSFSGFLQRRLCLVVLPAAFVVSGRGLGPDG